MKSILLILAVVVAAQQLPPRDVPPRSTGSAAIAGSVFTGETGSAPAGRARVMLQSTDGQAAPRTATTDDDGRFEFRGLPPGRFTIDVAKAGFLSASYGAAKPGRAGSPVSVADGGHITGLAIRLMRGAAITGTVRDSRGRPAPGVSVTALRFTYSWLGDRTLSAPSVVAATTDDRGVYRVWGLPPGDYLVAATPSVGVPNGPGSGSFRRLSATDVDQALRLARGINTGVSAEPPEPVGASAVDDPTTNYAPVFHPGTPDPQFAATVSIPGEDERAGVDIVIALVPTSKIAGTVRLPDGRAPAPTTVTLSATGEFSDLFASSNWNWIRSRSVRSDADGRFSFQDVAPGHYLVLAKTGPPASAAAQPANDGPPVPLMWASATVDVSGTSLQVQLDLQPAMAVAGKIVFEGTSAPPTDPGGLNIRLTPPGANIGGGPSGGQVTPDRAFTFTGVTPGRYRLTELFQRPWSGSWKLKSALANGRDAFDAPLIVTPGEDVELVLAYTDRPAEITGMFQDASSRPAPDYFIVIFPADRQLWSSYRRLSSTRPASDGHYSIRGLPPGEYLLVALTDFQSADLYTPSFLTDLSAMAVRVTIQDGQVTRQDLGIGR